MDRQTMMQFGIELKRLRKEKKLSQGRLGAAVGVHYNRIGKYESGAAYPSVPVLMKLSETLEASMDALIHGGTSATAADTASSPESAPETAAPPAVASSPDDTRLSALLVKIRTLPPEDRHIVIALLEAFLSRRAVLDLMVLGH